MNNYFSKRLFDLTTSEEGKTDFVYASTEYAFTPAATVAKAVAEEETPAEPETSKFSKSAMSLNANFTLSSEYNVSKKFEAKAFNGRRELKNKAQFGF